MNVLAFDTASPNPSVALLIDGRLFEQRPARLEIQLEHSVGASEVEVNRALVNRPVGASRLDRAEHLAGARIDQDEVVGAG